MANNHTGKQLIEKTMLEDLKKEYEDIKAINNKKKYPKGMTLLEYVLLTKDVGVQKSYIESLHKNYGKKIFEQNTSLISRIITIYLFEQENINLEVLDLLVENGANVNVSEGEYGPPLLASICFKKEKIFDWLVEMEDIDLTAHDKKGNALHKLIGEWNDNTKLRVERMLENFMQKAHSKGHLHKLQEQKSEERDLKPCKTDTEKDVLHKKFEVLSKKYEKRDELYKKREEEINNVLKKLFNGNVYCPIDSRKLEEFISNYCRCSGDFSACEEKVRYIDFGNLIKKLCNSMEYETFIRVFKEEDVFQNFITDIESIKEGGIQGNSRTFRETENVTTTSFVNNIIEKVEVHINQVIPSATTNPSPANAHCAQSAILGTMCNVGSGKLAAESTDQTDQINQTENEAKQLISSGGHVPAESVHQVNEAEAFTEINKLSSNKHYKTTGRTYAPADGSEKSPVSQNRPKSHVAETDNQGFDLDNSSTTQQNHVEIVAEEQRSASDPYMKSPEKELHARQIKLTNSTVTMGNETAPVQTGIGAMQSISGGRHVPAEPAHKVTEAFTEFQKLLFNDRFLIVKSVQLMRDGPPPRPWHQDEVWSEEDYEDYDKYNEL